MASVINIENLSFAFRNHLTLEDINLDIQEKDFIGIIGPNGGGKTTLLRLILGLLNPTRGSLSVLDTTPDKARPRIGYVPQYGRMDKNFPLRVRDVAAMGMLHPKSFGPRFARKDWQQVEDALQLVHLQELQFRQFGELSGGQRQRCLIARALVAKPRILLLDEPTASVDTTVETDIYELLRTLNKDITILLVSHDLGFVSSYINKVICINRLAAIHAIGEIDLQQAADATYHSHMTMLRHQCNL
jgi:zinc transport system ATP-binding protein